MRSRAFDAKTITRIAVITAMMCAVGPLTVPLPFSPINITLIQICIYASLFVTGTGAALACTTLYLFIGAVGVPVFSGFGAGFTKIAGPSGGYLIGYIFLVAIAGKFIENGGKFSAATGIFLGNTACYLFGTVWLAIYLHTGPVYAVSIGVLPYIIPDILKAMLVLSFSDRLKKLSGKYL